MAPYLLDIAAVLRAGAMRDSVSFHLANLLASVEGYAAYAALLGITVGLHLKGFVPLRAPLAVAALLGSGLLILSQNQQSHGVRLGIAAAYVLHHHLVRRWEPACRPCPRSACWCWETPPPRPHWTLLKRDDAAPATDGGNASGVAKLP